MIRFSFTTQKTDVIVPSGWHEITLQHILNLERQWSGTSSDMIGLLSALSGQTYEQIEKSKQTYWEEVFTAMSFVFDAPVWKKLSIPKTVTLGNKMVKVPKNLELETFGQKVLALKLITSDKDQILNIPEIIAIYLQPAYDGIFESSRVKDIKKMVLNMNCFEAMPIGLFFFRKLLIKKRFGKLGLKLSRKMLRSLASIQKRAQASSISSVT